MPTLLTCPECDATLKLAAPPPQGKKVKCPKCAAVFLPEAVEERRLSADRPVAPARSRSRPAHDDDDEDDRPRRPRRKKSQGGAGLLVGLLVGGGVLVVLLLGCTGVGVFLYLGMKPTTQPQPVAQANNPAPAAAPVQNPNPNPNGLGANGAGQEGNKGADNGAQPPVMPPAMPPNQGAGGQQQAPGGQGDNQVRVELSNARVSRLGARMEVSVDYKFTQGGPGVGPHLFVMIKGQRHSYEADIISLRVRGNQGTFNLGGISFGGPDPGPFEIWVETGFPGRFGPRQKISNTVTAN
jgi:hypothetical protein